ncbi:MAG: hypothetical protein LBI63_01725 [Candidatus Ancillula sp.]|jgi:23S rRNA (uracil1939-C5)-methyltransferase|nr:hypothetical protein [Candidatus Ancillula sp.]
MQLKPERMTNIGAVSTLPSGKKVFIRGALPDEEVEIETIEEHSRYNIAVASKILKRSPYRTEPKDDRYLATSPWQIMDFKYELELKSALLKEAFFLAGIEIDDVIIKSAGSQYFYRNKYNYLFTKNYNFAVIARKSNLRIKADTFSLPKKSINDTAVQILDVLRRSDIPPQDLDSLLVRTNDAGQTVSRLYITSKRIVQSQFKELNNFEICCLAQSNKKQHRHSQLLVNGTLELKDMLLGREFSYSIDSFFQINKDIYEHALSDMKIAVLGDVVDMYSGVGTIGLSVVPSRKKLKLIEIDAKNVKYAMKNARKYNMCVHDTCASTIASDASKALKYIVRDGTLILDPPRAGLSRTLVNQILEQLPDRILYLSCNPPTQARDVALLQEQYKILDIIGYNFFPKTPHIECLVILDRK